MSKYPTANITLASLEDKGMTMKIKDQDGKSWHVWKNDYQTKAPSEAYESLMNHKIGDTFGVTYGEKEENFNGKNYTKRTIYSITPTVSNPTPKNPLYDKSKAEEKDDKFWDMKAYKQCLWNHWLQTGKFEPDVVWGIFNDIEQDAKKRFFVFDKPKVESEPLPIIDYTEDINVEDIPFN